MAGAHPSRLETLLQQALPEPNLIKSGGDSAIVALALHCAHPSAMHADQLSSQFAHHVVSAHGLARQYGAITSQAASQHPAPCLLCALRSVPPCTVAAHVRDELSQDSGRMLASRGAWCPY